MKKAVVFLIIFRALCAFAETETVGGYTWTYRVVGDAVEIYNGFGRAVSPNPTGIITIPSTLGGKTVVGVGRNAFCDCSWLVRVIVPDCVRSIGNGAFIRCGALKSVTMPSVVYIKDSAFAECKSLADVVMPNVEQIGSFAFIRCASLKSVAMPSVAIIGRSAFRYCDRLTEVFMPNVISVADYAFNSCRALSDVMMTNVEDIGRETFSGCWGLRSVYMEDVKDIGIQAFNDCVKITNVLNLARVKNIRRLAFHNCKSLPEVIMPNVKEVGEEAFYGCGCLKRVNMSNVMSIGARAFLGCGKITAFSIDAANPKYKSISGLLLTKDGKTLIRGVGGSVVIPDDVTVILGGAFSGCSEMIDITFGTGSAYFGNNVFDGCRSLKKVVFKGNAPDVFPSNLYSGTDKSLVTYVEKGSVGWSGDGSKDLPEKWCGKSISYIGQEAR